MVRILLIEDDHGIVDSMTLLLELEGFEVSAARSGQQALELTRSTGPPALVIADCQLPDAMTGPEAVRELRQLVGDSLPAILQTGDFSQQVKKDVEGLDCPVLLKPVDPDELLRRMRELLAAGSR